MYNKINSQKKLIAVLSILACVMLTIFAMVVLQQTKKNENYDAWVIHTYEVLRTASRIVNNISEIESSYRGYFLTSSEAFLVPVSVLQNGVYADLERLEKMVVDTPEKIVVVHSLQDLFNRYKNLQEIQRQIYVDAGSSGLFIADIKQSQKLMNVLKIELERFISEELKNLTRRIDLRKTEQFYHVSTIVSGAAISVLGLIATTLIIIMLISKSAKTARRLHDIEELYSVIIESTNDGVYDYDVVNDKMIFSATYEMQLGYDANELPEQMKENFRQLVHPDDYQRVIDTAILYMDRKISKYSVDYRMKHKEGYWLWMLDRAVGTWNKEGKLVRMIGIHTDITAQKKQEEALRELNAELESFTYIASHDLRSPLVNLKGFAKEIDNSMQEVKEVHHRIEDMIPKSDYQALTKAVEEDIPEALSFIDTSVERMDSLTNAILNLSRIGRRVYKPALLDMNDLVKRCLKNLQYETNENNIQMIVSEVPDVYADPLAMEQIFSNILDNAVKYLSKDRQGEIHISALETQNETIYAIRDNGRGIQDRDKEKIFDIFQRARNSGDVRGAGMGLAFVKASVRKMGGRIWFESELDKRTTFYIALPRWKGGDHE